jgi:Mce-associated membrane protein
LLIGAIVLLVIALVCAGIFGYRWVHAANDDNAKYSAARDDVLRVGEGMALNFTAPDYQHLAQFKQRLEDSTTGTFHDQIGKTIDQYSAQINSAKLVTHSELVDGSVVALDVHANTATVLVVVRATKVSTGNAKNAQPPQQLPIVIALSRADSSSAWKATSVSGAPTTDGGQ